MTNRSPQLQQSFLLTGVGSAAVLVVLLALLAGNSANNTLRRQANDRGRDVATRVSALVTQYLRERRREAEVLAQLPDVVDAARKGAQDAVQRGLDKQDIATLERAFSGRRELGGDPTLQAFIRSYGEVSDFAEIFFTESHGYNVLASDRTSDFVQSDEDWWQQAFREGAFEGEPTYDSSSAAVSISYNVAVRPTKTARPVGVLKAVFALDRLSRLLAAADLGGDAVLEVVDEHGHVVVSPDPKLLLEPLPDAGLIPRRNVAVDTTIVCTEDSSSCTSAVSACCDTTLIERSPPAIFPATSPAIFTGRVTRRFSHVPSAIRTAMVTANNASAPIQICRLVARAAA